VKLAEKVLLYITIIQRWSYQFCVTKKVCNIYEGTCLSETLQKHGANRHLVLPKLLEMERVKVNAGKRCH
jgi:hypothetical protein